MTDKEIFKAFEQQVNLANESNKMSILGKLMLADVLDLINRQQAEIERLKKLTGKEDEWKMKCDNCGHVCSQGYEYPEYYCELGIADNPRFEKYDTGDGCSLTKKQRIKRCEELNKMEYTSLWWDESEEKK